MAKRKTKEIIATTKKGSMNRSGPSVSSPLARMGGKQADCDVGPPQLVHLVSGGPEQGQHHVQHAQDGVQQDRAEKLDEQDREHGHRRQVRPPPPRQQDARRQGKSDADGQDMGTTAPSISSLSTETRPANGANIRAMPRGNRSPLGLTLIRSIHPKGGAIKAVYRALGEQGTAANRGAKASHMRGSTVPLWLPRDG